MNTSYKLGKYRFNNVVTYRAGVKDIERIRYIQNRYSLKPENTASICKLINDEHITFQTIIGKDYLKTLDSYKKELQLRQKKTRKKRARQKALSMNLNILIKIVGVLILAVIAYTSMNFYQNYKSKKAVENLKAEMAIEKNNTIFQSITKQVDTKELMADTEFVILPEHQSLYEKNNDFIGWLSIENTDIDYPVMWKNGDNEFYLSHNFEGESDRNGLLVLDYRCDIKNRNMNFLIHGHNMRSGTMFGQLKKYREKSYYEAHRYINFNTLYEKNTYEIVAVFISEIFDAQEDVFKYYDCLSFANEQEYYEFIRNIKEMQLYETNVDTQVGDSFILLSTCDYSREDGRLVILARRLGGQ